MVSVSLWLLANFDDVLLEFGQSKRSMDRWRKESADSSRLNLAKNELQLDLQQLHEGVTITSRDHRGPKLQETFDIYFDYFKYILPT